MSVRLTKPIARVLDRIFAAEIENRLPCQLRDSAALREAVSRVLVEKVEMRLGGQFPVTIKGYELTHYGRHIYWEWASKQLRNEASKQLEGDDDELDGRSFP